MTKTLIALYFSTFTTLFAIINPLEVLPVFINLTKNNTEKERLATARKACLYAFLLLIFFLFFGAFILKLFSLPLSMVRIVGGIILMRIGFDLFSPSAQGTGIVGSASAGPNSNIAFVPLAMPLICGPGTIATLLGMTATIKDSSTELVSMAAVIAAIITAIGATLLCLIYSGRLVAKIGPMGIDATTRIVGFFVAAMGVALIFDGVVEALQSHGVPLT